MSTATWAETYLQLPSEQADVPAGFDLYYAPYLLGIFHAWDSDAGEVVTQKGAQIAYTTALGAYLGARIDRDPCAIVGLFAGEEAAREWVDEKFVPTVQATPALARRIDTTTSRKAGNRALFKRFPGGFLKLGGSRSIHKVKSTPAPLVFVEEPDDSKENLRDQGDAIQLLWERAKRFRRSKRILGGTPSVKGISRVEAHLERSDKRVLPIRCHGCGESHVLGFEHVRWQEAGPEHPIYGQAQPETAVYACPHCGLEWSDAERKSNIRATCFDARTAGDPWGGWEPTAEFHGTYGFHELGEVYSCLPGAGLPALVRDYLEAQHRKALGDENAWIVFVNSKLGRPYEYTGEEIGAEQLRDRADDYPPLQIPRNGLLVTAGIDVQHDRLYVIIRAWGPGAESWLLYFDEISAERTSIDREDRCWSDLSDLLFRTFPSAAGYSVPLSALTIDCSDGHTSDAVYSWVRTQSRQHRNVRIMAGKGDSNSADAEVFTTPRRKVDHQRADKQTKADRHGVQVWMIGTNKAKDWLDGHLRLKGDGPGRFHWFLSVRDDYLEHLTAEVKAPSRRLGGRKVWQLRPGKPNHGLDCEVYALHAAWSQRVHIMQAAKWDELRARLSQPSLFDALPEAPTGASPKTPSMSLEYLARKLNG